MPASRSSPDYHYAVPVLAKPHSSLGEPWGQVPSADMCASITSSTTDLLTSRTHRSGVSLGLPVALTLRGLLGCSTRQTGLLTGASRKGPLARPPGFARQRRHCQLPCCGRLSRCEQRELHLQVACQVVGDGLPLGVRVPSAHPAVRAT